MSMEYAGSIVTATFTTKAINFVFTVYNTESTYCTANPPTATVTMEDVNPTTLTIYNL
jgi:hypothetical protein